MQRRMQEILDCMHRHNSPNMAFQAFGTDLIEMETVAFYLMADLIEKPAIALLVVSDNSSSGEALVGRTEEQQKRYEKGKKEVLPKMVLALAKGEK